MQRASRSAAAQAAGDTARRAGGRLRGFTLGDADERRRDGALEFHDLLVLARDAAARHHAPRCAPRCTARYQHLLLDEFQDTDPIQIELAVLLAPPTRRRAPTPWRDARARRRAGCSSSATRSSRSTASAAPTSRLYDRVDAGRCSTAERAQHELPLRARLLDCVNHVFDRAPRHRRAPACSRGPSRWSRPRTRSARAARAVTSRRASSTAASTQVRAAEAAAVAGLVRRCERPVVGDRRRRDRRPMAARR